MSVNNSLVKAKPNPMQVFNNTVSSQLNNQFKAIKSLVPKHVTPERLCRIALNAVTRNPKLMECSPETIVGSVVSLASLGLEPNLLGHAYIVPFYNNKTKKMEAQYQIGYKGALDLVRRTGEVSNIYAYTVYENDEFDYSLGLDLDLKHKPAKEKRGNPIYYYAVYKLKDGGFGFAVMSQEEVMEHAKKFSKSQKDGRLFGPWADNFESMALKTVILKLIKYMPLSIEKDENLRISEALSGDGATVTIKEDSNGDGVIDAQYVYTDQSDEENGSEDQTQEQEAPKTEAAPKTTAAKPEVVVTVEDQKAAKEAEEIFGSNKK